TGIEFLSRTLFRARIPVPASVPPGEYRAEVYLFQNGTIASAQSSPLFIDKSGFERQVYNYAYQASFAYGFAAVLMALALGWAGDLVFRQSQLISACRCSTPLPAPRRSRALASRVPCTRGHLRPQRGAGNTDWLHRY